MTCTAAYPKWFAKRTVQPASEPLTLTQVKDHVGQALTDDDTKLTAFLTACREAVENYLNRTLITTTWVMRMRCFPADKILIPYSPLIAVTSIAYDAASDGAATTLDSANYRASTYADPGEIEPAFGLFWPTARDQSESVRVTYTAGYGATAGDVPLPIKQGILAMIGTCFANRETIITGTIKAEVPEVSRNFLYPYRSWWM